MVELAFLPGLVLLIAPPILRERNRNLPMLFVLAVLWTADAVSLLAIARADAMLASRAFLAAINVVLLLITIIGGRIVPAFTSNALRRVDQSFSIRSYPWLERVLPAAMAINILFDLWQPALALPAGVLALALAILHAWRLSGWRSLRARGEPILWVLHLGYAWLPAGFALKAVNLLTDAVWARFWLHAFGIGSAVAYGLLGAAALVRVAAPWIWTGDYFRVLVAAGMCWSAAFAIFVAIYTPVLAGPRIDGKAG